MAYTTFRRSDLHRVTVLIFIVGCNSNYKGSIDADGDGYDSSNDCNDANPEVHSQSIEQCNGIDDDCDGQIDETDGDIIGATQYFIDSDGDGFGAGEGAYYCEAPLGASTVGTDCNDEDSGIYPLADELCNGIDDDCDENIDESPPNADFWFPDNDGDGYGTVIGAVRSCEMPSGFVDNSEDCDDDDPLHSPETTEVCDGIDNDCDELIDDEDQDVEADIVWYLDGDGDGYGITEVTIRACAQPEGYTDLLEDCNDSESTISPGILYDRCDGVDNDCDLEIDEDIKPDWPMFSADTSSGVVWDISMTNSAMIEQSTIQDTYPRINSMDVSENGISVVHDYLHGQLYTMDACTGTLSLIGPHFVGNNCGIVFGPNGKLYGLDTSIDSLVEFDLSTGIGSVIGSIGVSIGNCGLAYDCANDRLVGANGSNGEIFTLDPQTGLAHDFIQTDVPFQSVGLEYVPKEQMLYASTGSELYTVEPQTGTTSYVGELERAHIDDLALHPVCP
jgi:hypothetical protein